MIYFLVSLNYPGFSIRSISFARGDCLDCHCYYVSEHIIIVVILP